MEENEKKPCGNLLWHTAFAALYVMSLFVWDIDFAGNMRYTDSYLLQFVKNEATNQV